MLPLLALLLSQSAQDLVERGVKKFEAWEYQAAIVDFNQAIEADPRNGTAFFNRGLCWARLDQPKKAILDLSRAIEILPEFAQAYLDRGIARAKSDDLEGAFKDFSQALEKNPKLGWAWSNRAKIREGRGDLELALVDFDRAVGAEPENPSFLNNRGALKSQMGKDQSAIEDFDEALRLNPKYAWAWHNRAVSQRHLGQLQLAQKDVTRAVELDSANPSSLRERGEIRDALKDFDGALADFTKALGQDPRYAAAYNSRGLTREHQSDLEGALADYEKAIEFEPGVGHAYNNRSRIFEGREEFARAEAELSRWIEAAPKTSKAWESRGRIRSLMENPQGALEDFTRSLEINPKNQSARYARGWIFKEQGNLDRALAEFETYVRLAPDDPWGYDSRGAIKLEKGDAGGALGDAAKAIELDPEHYTAYELQSRIWRRTWELRKALAALDRMTEIKPDWAGSFTTRGRVHKQLRHWDDARSDFSVAIQKNPKNPWNPYYLALLDFDQGRWAEAIESLGRCREIQPPDSDYVQIRLWIARSKSGSQVNATQVLVNYLRGRNREDWSAIIGAFLVGDLPEEGLLERARSGEARKLEGRLLEARYYAAVRRALEGDRAKAVEYLKLCLASEARTFFEYDSAISELESLEPGAVDRILPPTAEDMFERIEDRAHRAAAVRVEFTYEARPSEAAKPTLTASGSILVKRGNRVLAKERLVLEGKVIEKKQISDGSKNAFWIGEERTDKPLLKNEGAKVLNGILRAGYIQAQLIKVNYIPLDPDGDVGNLDPKIFIPLQTFSFGDEEKGSRTILYRFKDDPRETCKIWYDPKTLTLLKRTIEFPGPEGSLSTETYSAFVLDEDIPDRDFEIPGKEK